MSKNKHINRKRLKKLLMSQGYSRNEAQFFSVLAKSMNQPCEHCSRMRKKRGVKKDA